MPLVDWQPWHTTAFLAAQRQRRPVLLLLETAWSPACAQAHAEVFTRPDVATAVADTAIAVRVDADRRPDIGDRYGLGHWPTLLFLTPEGRVLAGGTQLDQELASWIRDVARAFGEADGHFGVGHVAPRHASDVDAEAAVATIAHAVRAACDPQTGAFVQGNAPSAAAALFALAQATVTGDAAWATLASATIDALDHVPRSDHAPDVLAFVPDAGDWPRVARLEDQAEWTRVLARAVRLEPLDAWVTRLESLVRGLRGFRRPDGHWRPWSGSPRLVLVDASARACGALLAASDALERPDLAEEAIHALEVLAPVAYARASGVAHVVDDGLARGPMLLDDAMALAHALLDADAWRADDVYRDLAEEIARTTIARLQDDSGALNDRVAALAGAGQVGRLAEPHHPLVGNAEAVRLLCRLFGDDPAWRVQAHRILQAVTVDAARADAFGAPVGLAWHAVGTAGSVTAAW